TDHQIRSCCPGAVTCGSDQAPTSVELTGSAVVPRVVEARRSRVARAPSRSDAAGALDLGGTAPQAARRRRRHPRKRHKSPQQLLAQGTTPTRAGPLCANCYRAGARLAFLKL